MHSTAWRVMACGLALAIAGATFAADDDEKAAREAEIKQRLEAVRDQQRALSEEQSGTLGERRELVAQLRADELKVAEVAKTLRAFDEALAARQSELEALAEQEKAVQTRLTRQRDAIAVLLRSAYALGRHDQLRMLFAPEQVRDAARLLAYHRYLERDRSARVRKLAEDLAEFARVRAAVDQARVALEQGKADQARESESLAAARDTRKQSLAALEARLADQQQRLAALGKDEKQLLSLIEQIRDVIGDVPKVLAGDVAFASLRARLPWPLSGPVLQRFGTTGPDGRVASGVLIGATAGAQVNAVSHGRVAYADWLKGYGLLIILDHGDGFLSLYAHNETLLKEVGDWVDAGDAIATAGASGGRPETGVYFELRQRGRAIDPAAWLTKR